MGACGSSSKAVQLGDAAPGEQSKVASAPANGSPPVAVVQADSDLVMAAPDFDPGRPKRSGSWFIVHEATLAAEPADYQEKVDVYHEFFEEHPNGGSKLAGFVAIKLSPENIKRLRLRLRISSYRWRDMKGVGPDNKKIIPGNFMWFLDHCREQRLIGWMDFIANAVVNVPTHETLAYMGGLYANCIVLGQWLLEPAQLPEALSRGWIYQESTFGELDRDSVNTLTLHLRGLGLALRGRGAEAVTAYIQACTALSELLTRRGYGDFANKSKLLSHLEWDDEDELASFLHAQQGCDETHVIAAHAEMEDDIYSDAHFYQPAHFFALADEGAYEAYAEEFAHIVCASPHANVKPGANQFFQAFGESILYAVMETQLTYETDREAAVTQVARSILHEQGADLSASEVVTAAWENLHHRMACGRFAYVGFNRVTVPIAPGASTFALGRLRLSGAMLKIRDGNASYETRGHGEAQALVDGLQLDILGVKEEGGHLVHWTGDNVELCLCVSDAEQHGRPLSAIVALKQQRKADERCAVLSLSAGISYHGFERSPAPQLNFWSE